MSFSHIYFIIIPRNRAFWPSSYHLLLRSVPFGKYCRHYINLQLRSAILFTVFLNTWKGTIYHYWYVSKYKKCVIPRQLLFIQSYFIGKIKPILEILYKPRIRNIYDIIDVINVIRILDILSKDQ